MHLGTRLSIALTMLCAPLASAQTSGRPAVRVNVDVHVPVPVVQVPVPVVVVPESPPAPHRPPPPRRRDEAPPPPEWSEPERPPHRGHGFHVPPDRVPGHGQCRIWFDDLPPDRQPPPMSCDRAHHVARRHGGRVIWAESDRAHQDGRVASTWYGSVDFRGVPPDRLPPPGSCRVWVDGVPPDRQAPPSSCEHAAREARRMGGRILYMPGP